MFKGVDMLFTTFITEWVKIQHNGFVLVSVGGLNSYAFDVKEPTLTVLSILIASLNDVTSAGLHPTTKVIKLE